MSSSSASRSRLSVPFERPPPKTSGPARNDDALPSRASDLRCPASAAVRVGGPRPEAVESVVVVRVGGCGRGVPSPDGRFDCVSVCAPAAVGRECGDGKCVRALKGIDSGRLAGVEALALSPNSSRSPGEEKGNGGTSAFPLLDAVVEAVACRDCVGSANAGYKSAYEASA